MVRMNPEIKRKWVESIRSAPKLAIEFLHEIENGTHCYCVVGHACELHRQDHPEYSWFDRGDGTFGYGRDQLQVEVSEDWGNDEVKLWLDIPPVDELDNPAEFLIAVDDIGVAYSMTVLEILMELNDRFAPKDEIADLIEKYL